MGYMRFLKYAGFLILPFLGSCVTPSTQPSVQPPVQQAKIDTTQIETLFHDSPSTSMAAPQVFDNCSVTCPVGGSPVTLARDTYTLNNNGSTKFANWVAYKVTKATSASGRDRNWHTDPDLPAGETLDPADYDGASEALKIDRGHQANLASLGGIGDWQTLNYLSNITPQKSALNRGPWEHLEAQERKLSKQLDVDAVYVLTGPLYERFVGVLPGTKKIHTIPSGYWKIVVLGSTPENGLYASFVMDQDLPRNADFCNYQVTVKDIEQRSGLTFWSGLPAPVQASLKSARGQLPSRLGCQ